ncbi:MarR family winged helix-turn-helix transcriptional regulator [Streptomyces sp. NPDC004111]|uniref:MarR family winged helix-turn-helix transcriptional regulator n=1 Tax=Streptomyces sp. NPDC004111 TaxID=3364690 RepID=UPI00369E9552
MGAPEAGTAGTDAAGAQARDTEAPEADVPEKGVPDTDVRDLVIALHRLMRSLRRAAPSGRFQPTQLIVLTLLYERSPARIGELAAKVPCSQPTATAAVAALETRGLVRREPDPTDGRASSVLLTAAGVAALTDVAGNEAEVLTARLAALDPEQARAVVALGPVLRRLAEAEDG